MSLTGMTTQLKVSSTKGQNSSYNRDSFALKTKRERERRANYFCCFFITTATVALLVGLSNMLLSQRLTNMALVCFFPFSFFLALSIINSKTFFNVFIYFSFSSLSNYETHCHSYYYYSWADLILY